MPLYNFGGRIVEVEIARSPRARRVTLRADAVRGIVRVAVPPRARLAEADRIVAEHRGWIAAKVAGWPDAVPFVPGATIPFDGGSLTLDWAADHPRGVRRASAADGAPDEAGGEAAGRLVIGGPHATVPGRTRRWLLAAALADLGPATLALAAGLGRTVTVAVRDPRSRWGSCSSSGVISFSWRLILAPPAVRQSVVAHEVAHLVHANHGRDFWRLAKTLTIGDLAAARGWLKANGAALHWVGREV